MLFINAYTIFFVTLFSTYLATLGFRAAVVVIGLDVIYTWLGGFYDEMDLTGWAMLCIPTVSALIAASLSTWWRKTHPPKPDFIAPPLTQEQRARRGRRRSGRDEGTYF